MIKLKDEISGGVFPDGKISKPLTANDRLRLAQAEDVCRKILIEAGAERSSIFMTPLRGTHPSGTVRLGTLVDQNLQAEAPGLYVCDASVFPEALDRPTVLTIIGLAKREEEIFLPGRSESIKLEERSPVLKLIQQVRDEAHRFAVTFHLQVRTRKGLQMLLDEIEGIGPRRREKLMRHFGPTFPLKASLISSPSAASTGRGCVVQTAAGRRCVSEERESVKV